MVQRIQREVITRCVNRIIAPECFGVSNMLYLLFGNANAYVLPLCTRALIVPVTLDAVTPGALGNIVSFRGGVTARHGQVG